MHESTQPTKHSRRSALKLGVVGSVALAGGLNPRAESFAAAKESAASATSAFQTAKRYVETLSAEQKAIAVLEFQDKKRLEWHFIPMETRKGLPLRDMNESQRTAAIAILKQVLSPVGFQRTTEIMDYESILLELEGPTAVKRRDYTKYYFTIFGEPSETAAWGLSVEGHHLSINYTFEKGAIVDSTPQFFGINPAGLRKDFKIPDITKAGGSVEFKKGKRLLAAEEDAGFELLKSLTASQLNQAIYDKECPDDIQWAGEPQPQLTAKVGIAAKDLDAQQQKKLIAILDAFAMHMPAEVIKQRMDLIKKAGVDQIYFGWAGATELQGQHFFRIQGPTFIVEFCNFQKDPEGNIANHIHSIWRDMTGDFNLSIASK